MGALLAWGVSGKTVAPAPGAEYHLAQAFFAEVIVTHVLAMVVLNVGTTKSQEKNDHYGLAIGMIVFTGAYTCGPISGGVFNPAVGSALLFVNWCAGEVGRWNIWLYWTAPLLGGILAGPLFMWQNRREYFAFHFHNLFFPSKFSSFHLFPVQISRS